MARLLKTQTCTTAKQMVYGYSVKFPPLCFSYFTFLRKSTKQNGELLVISMANHNKYRQDNGPIIERTKGTHVTGSKRAKTRVTKSQVVFVLHMIGSRQIF